MKTNHTSFELKDAQRIADMIRKAKGNDRKLAQLARNMAKAITSADKALRRCRAAEDVNYHDIAQIFKERFQDLSAPAGQTFTKQTFPSKPDFAIKTTDFERYVLNCLARNSYTQANYGRPRDYNDCSGGVWTHSILDADTTDYPEPKGFTKTSLPGVVASLVNKGFVCTTEDGKDSTTGLTRAGYERWLILFPEHLTLADEQKSTIEKIRGVLSGIAPEDLTTAEAQILKLIS